MRVTVVGHVEWVEFARVERMPRPGEIVHSVETWEEAAGGGAVAAVQLAKLAGTATLFSALGVDELLLLMQTAGVPHEKVCESIRLFGEEVIPSCRA